MVDALDNLAERALVDDLDDLVAVPQLLTHLCDVVALLVGYLELVLSPHFPDGVDLFENA